MTLRELHQAVARATGESRGTIRQLGFSLLEPELPDDVSEPQSYSLDCPGCGAEVPLTDGGFLQLPELAECRVCDAAYPYEHTEIFACVPAAVLVGGA